MSSEPVGKGSRNGVRPTASWGVPTRLLCACSQAYRPMREFHLRRLPSP
jgi:hypothetical protein